MPVLIFTFLALFLFVDNVSAHGRMLSPQIRLAPGDSGNGFTLANGPIPRDKAPCAGLSRGSPQTTYKSGQTIQVEWLITAAHQGSCSIELSTTGDESKFKKIASLPRCADTTGKFKASVKLPNVNCNRCIMRFVWNAKLTQELYSNCADIKIVNNKKRSVTYKRSTRRANRIAV